MKIQKEEGEVKKVEGYVDQDRNVFVVTGDPHGILGQPPEERPLDEKEIDYKSVSDLIKKYKPEFLAKKE